MMICIMSGVEPLSQPRKYIFLDQPCPIAHDNDIGIFLFHQLRFFLPSVRTFLFHQPGFFSAIRNEAYTARFLHRILSLLHRILSFLYWIFSLLHRILSLFEWESWFGFFSSISWNFFLPSVGIFLFHQSGFFLPSETRPLRHGSCIGYFPSCIGYFSFCIGYFLFCIGYFPF